MQDRPTAPELLRAAREFCERDLIPELTGRRRFHTRVLANVLGILEREWTNEEDAVAREWERLAMLLDSDDERPASFKELGEQVRAGNAELAANIRAGRMDDRWEETLTALKATVADKLAISNPSHSSETT